MVENPKNGVIFIDFLGVSAKNAIGFEILNRFFGGFLGVFWGPGPFFEDTPRPLEKSTLILARIEGLQSTRKWTPKNGHFYRFFRGFLLKTP